MIKRLIIFLVRKKLKVKKYEVFQFDNQKRKQDEYFISEDTVWKLVGYEKLVESQVPLNYLLSDECKITRLGGI